MKQFELPEYGIIDCHMHPYLAGDRKFPFAIPENYDDFFAELHRAGITLCCGSFNIANDGSSFDVIRECNRRVLELHCSRPGKFMPGMNVHPAFPEESCAEIMRFYDLGFRWIGEIAGYVMNFRRYCQGGFLPIMDLAQDLGMVLNIHPSDMEDVENILKNFPKLKLLLAHPGAFDIMENYQLGKKYPNLYFDLSGTGLFRWGMLKKGVQMLGAERILFGTDFPIVNPGMYVAGVIFEHISEAEKKLILRDNFLRICEAGK